MKQAKVLSSEELKRVMAICASMQNGKRNRLMLMLSHYAGMRVGEIASGKPRDLSRLNHTNFRPTCIDC